MIKFKCLLLFAVLLLALVNAKSIKKNNDSPPKSVGEGDELRANNKLESKIKANKIRETDFLKLKAEQIRDTIYWGTKSLRIDFDVFVAKNGLAKIDDGKWRALNSTVEKRLDVFKQTVPAKNENHWGDFLSDYRTAIKEFIQGVSQKEKVKREEAFLENGFAGIVDEIGRVYYSDDVTVSNAFKSFFGFANRASTTPATDVAQTNQTTSSGGVLHAISQAVNNILRPNSAGAETQGAQNDTSQNNTIQNPTATFVIHNGEVISGSQNQNQTSSGGVFHAISQAVSNILRPNSTAHSQANQNVTNDNVVQQNDNGQSTNANKENQGSHGSNGSNGSNGSHGSHGSQNRPNRKKKPKPQNTPMVSENESNQQSSEKPFFVQILNIYTDPDKVDSSSAQYDEGVNNKNATQPLNIVIHLIYDKPTNQTGAPQNDKQATMSLSSPPDDQKDVIADVNTTSGEPLHIYLDFSSIFAEILQKNNTSASSQPNDINKNTPSELAQQNNPSTQRITPQNDAIQNAATQNAVTQNDVTQTSTLQLTSVETNNNFPQTPATPITQKVQLPNYSKPPPLPNYSVHKPNSGNSSLHVLVISTPKKN